MNGIDLTSGEAVAREVQLCPYCGGENLRHRLTCLAEFGPVPRSISGLSPKADLAPVEVRKVTPEEVLANYPLLREGCAAIKAVNGSGPMAATPSGDWQPQHILAGLLNGQLEMWGAWRDGVLKGFGVTQMLQSQYSGIINAALVFLAYKSPLEKSDAYARVAAFIAETMKARGCEYLEAYTRRSDLAKSEALGWHQSFAVIRLPLWEKENNDG